MNLIARKEFSDSTGTHAKGEPFAVHSLSYGRQLITQGLADIHPHAFAQQTATRPGKAMLLRGASGFGDAIYLRPIVEYFIVNQVTLEVISDYAGVFADLGVKVHPYVKSRATLAAHYGSGKYRIGTTQFQDMCISAGIPPLEFHSRWEIRNPRLVERIEGVANGRKIILVHGGRVPMGEDQAFMSMAMLPSRRGFDLVCAAARDALLIRVGKGRTIYDIPCELDLSSKTSVEDVMDLGFICDGVIAQCSFVVPLAEIFGKPLLAIWAAKNATAPHPFIKAITPEKILTRQGSTSRVVVDEWPEEKIKEVADAFLDF